MLDNPADTTMISRPSPIGVVRVLHETAGLLAIQRPQRSCRFISIRYLGTNFSSKHKGLPTGNIYGSDESPQADKKEALTDEDVNSWVKDTHSALREIHQSIFLEQVILF